MTDNKKFKRQVRERMRETGERYTQARSELLGRSYLTSTTAPSDTPPRSDLAQREVKAMEPESVQSASETSANKQEHLFQVVMTDGRLFEVQATGYRWDDMISGRVAFYAQDDEVASFAMKEVVRVALVDRVTLIAESSGES